MRNLVILLLILVNYGVCSATDILPGIRTDHKLHALTSYVICDIAKDCGASKSDKFWLITGLGISKEIIDEQLGGTFDCADIAFNYLGFLVEGTGIKYHNGYFIIKNEWLF